MPWEDSHTGDFPARQESWQRQQKRQKCKLLVVLDRYSGWQGVRFLSKTYIYADHPSCGFAFAYHILTAKGNSNKINTREKEVNSVNE